MIKNGQRSLLLAGGGIKVAYQAGCLQVLLDEAQLEFHHVDAASGGCLNAAMLFSGLSGTEIADNWRRTNPFDMISFNTREFKKLFWARSLGKLDKMRDRLFPAWGIDWKRIRAESDRIGTFNVYDFTAKELRVIENSEMDEDFLLASVALPMWFPPVERDGKTYFDAVFATDCNVGEAILRGADEVWCVWTVARMPQYRDGFLAQYFHIIETSANTRFFSEWKEIELVNRLIERKGPVDSSNARPSFRLLDGVSLDDGTVSPPPGRKPIEQHLIQQEVPLHYLINVSQDRLAEAVELGVRDARAYCVEKGLLPKTMHRAPTRPVSEAPTRLVFSETMRGEYVPGTEDPEALLPEMQQDNGKRATLRITIHIENLDSFLRQPEHEARISGLFECEPEKEPMPIERGVFQLFTIVNGHGPDDPSRRRMRYDVTARSPSGVIYRLEGVKFVENDLGFDSLKDLTTLYSRVYTRLDEGAEKLLGAGVLRIHTLDFMRQLASFRVPGAPGVRDSFGALGRFGQFFAGRAWDVYAKDVLDYAPI